MYNLNLYFVAKIQSFFCCLQVIMSSGDENDNNTTLGVAEQLRLLEEVIQKLLYRDLVAQPQQCQKPADIKAHLDGLDKFFNLSKINNDDQKIAILFNTITEEMRLEICCQLEFHAHQNDYKWIEGKLKDLFHPKESEITPLVKLYGVKQKPQQTLREFLSEVRIEGYRLLKNLNPEEREKHLVDVFIKGLRNNELKTALNRREIKTLEEAYRLIKKEKCVDDDNCYVRQINACDEVNADVCNDLKDLKRDISVMQKQLESIVTILRGIKTLQPTYAEAVRKQRQVNTSEYGRQVPVQERKYYAARQQAPAVPRYEARRQAPVVRDSQRNIAPVVRDSQRNILQCWTCGENGHISRFCSMNRCNNCGKRGHTSWNCRIPKKPFNVRHLQEDSWDVECELNDNDSDSLDSSPVSNSHPEIHSGDETAQIHALTIDEGKKRKNSSSTKTSHHKRSRKQPQYPEYINELYDYIQGRRSRKNVRFEKPETLITTGHSEKARNKPIIRGKCHGKPSKIFLDTGAEINVIDKSFVKQLSDENFIKINRASKVIRCANSSRLNVEGWVRMWVEVAGHKRQCKFWVIDNLFPKIIMGIRAMKDFNMTVDPGKGCTWIGTKSVPFLSTIQSQSVSGKSQGNDNVPGLRVETRRI